MEKVARSRTEGVPFNTPLETGVRSVGLLAALYPKPFDLQRMVAFDYLVVHTADLGGPQSLHPELPMRNAELLVRRELVERGILLMLTRNLVERVVDAEGIAYRAGEMADVFLSSLTTEYMTQLQLRAQWVAEMFGEMTDEEFHSIMRRHFDKWVEQFQAIERPLNAGGAA